MRHDSKVDNGTRKPNIVQDYNKTKGAVYTIGKMCHKYSVKRCTRRWPLYMFLWNDCCCYECNDLMEKEKYQLECE